MLRVQVHRDLAVDEAHGLGHICVLQGAGEGGNDAREGPPVGVHGAEDVAGLRAVRRVPADRDPLVFVGYRLHRVIRYLRRVGGSEGLLRRSRNGLDPVAAREVMARAGKQQQTRAWQKPTRTNILLET